MKIFLFVFVRGVMSSKTQNMLAAPQSAARGACQHPPALAPFFQGAPTL
jgi:hypothetical protein